MIGTTIGPYEIIEEIGHGGMATVYRARQVNMDRYVAIKIIHKAIAAERTSLDRFQREARLIARLEHPHILPVYDYNGAHDPPYIVMRFMSTGTLKDILKRDQLRFGEVTFLIRQMASALDYAHRQGIVHRDIKPSNIMIDAEGNAFLTDFGIARMVEGTEGLTASGLAVGTPGYMAPEQGMGLPIDGRVDIYALGVMLFELLTGQTPFKADTPMAVILKHINEPIPVASSYNPDIPPIVDGIIAKAMAKNADDRYQTATELADALAEVLGASGTSIPKRLQQIASQTIAELEKARADASARSVRAAPPTHLEGVPTGAPPHRFEDSVVRPVSETVPSPGRFDRRQVPLYAGMGVLLVVLIGIILFLLTQGGGKDQTPAAPQANCPDIVQQAIMNARSVCAAVPEGQVCYAHGSIVASSDAGPVEGFSEPGHLLPLAEINSLETAGFDLASESWGLAVANAPLDLPSGQEATVLLWGEVELLPRDPDLRRFTVRTGITLPACGEQPRAGLIVQVPPGQTATFEANGVTVTTSSTVMLHAQSSVQMSIFVLEGYAEVSAMSTTRYVPAGYSTRVAVDSLLAAVSAPVPPERIQDMRQLVNLEGSSPLELLAVPLQSIDIATAVALAPELTATATRPPHTPTFTPSETPSPTLTQTPTDTATSTETPSNTPTASATNTDTATWTPTPTASPTATGTFTQTPSSTATSTDTDTPSPTATDTATQTATATFTKTPTDTATSTPSATATDTPTLTQTASFTPSSTATNTPTYTQTRTPTRTATVLPTATPTNTPTRTATPTATDTLPPTSTHTPSPPPTATNIPSPTPLPSPTQIPGGSMPYVADMEGDNPLVGWDYDPTRWQVINDGGNMILIGQSGLDSALEILGREAPEWKSESEEGLLIDMHVNLQAANSIGRIIFRYSEQGYYVFEILSGYAMLRRGGPGPIDRDTEQLLRDWRAAPIQTGRWYHISIWAEGSRIHVFFDNMLQLRANDTGFALPVGGAVLLQTLSAVADQVAFDDITIQRPIGASEHFEGATFPDSWQASGLNVQLETDADGNQFITMRDEAEVGPQVPPLSDVLVACRMYSEVGGFSLLLRNSNQGRYLLDFDAGNLEIILLSAQGDVLQRWVRTNYYGRTDWFDFTAVMTGNRLVVYRQGEVIFDEDIADAPTAGGISFQTTAGDLLRLDDCLFTETKLPSTVDAQFAFEALETLESRLIRDGLQDWYEFFSPDRSTAYWWESDPGEYVTEATAGEHQDYYMLTTSDQPVFRLFRREIDSTNTVFGSGSDRVRFANSSDIYVRVFMRLPPEAPVGSVGWAGIRSTPSITGFSLNQYQIEMVKTASDVVNLRVRANTPTDKSVVFEEPLEWIRDGWHELLMVAHDDRVAFFADGRFLTAVRDAELLGGTMAIGAEPDSMAQFDDIVLRDTSVNY